MKAWRPVVGAATGLLLTAGVLAGLAEYSTRFAESVQQEDAAQLRATAVWLILLGAVLGVAVLVSRWIPLASAVASILLLICYVPFYFDVGSRSWLPTWVEERVFRSLGVAPPLVIGVLVAAALWPLLEKAASSRGQPSTSPPEPRQALEDLS